eukprot:1189887-Prorocentrum_minimum.AAC.1
MPVVNTRGLGGRGGWGRLGTHIEVEAVECASAQVQAVQRAVLQGAVILDGRPLPAPTKRIT